MEVYVDVLIVLNIFVTYFLLLGAALLLRQRVKKLRLVCGAFLGGFYSLVIFLPQIPNVLAFLMHLAASSILVLVTFAPRSIRRFLKAFFAFFAVNFLFAGLMLGIWLFFKPANMVYNNAAVYFDIDVKTLVISTVCCYVALTLFSYILKRRTPSSTLYDITLEHHGKSVHAKALLDTGHTLSDGFSNTPILVAESSVLKRLFPSALYAFLQDDNFQEILPKDEKIRLIPIGTVSGNGMLKAVLIDALYIPQKNICQKNILLAQSKTQFSSTEYEVLLSPQVFDEREEEKTNAIFKKAHFKN